MDFLNLFLCKLTRSLIRQQGNHCLNLSRGAVCVLSLFDHQPFKLASRFIVIHSLSFTNYVGRFCEAEVRLPRGWVACWKTVGKGLVHLLVSSLLLIAVVNYAIFWVARMCVVGVAVTIRAA